MRNHLWSGAFFKWEEDNNRTPIIFTLTLVVRLPDRRDAPDGGSRVYPGVKKIIAKLIAEQYNLKKMVIKRVLRYSAVGRRTVSDIQHYKG